MTFSDSNGQSTYASGANKIFQLAVDHPIAVMIYNNANLHQVPWELILKAYREELGKKSFRKVGDYATDLVRFLNQHVGLLPPAMRYESTLAAYRKFVIRILHSAFESADSLKNVQTPAVTLQAIWTAFFAKVCAEIQAAPIHANLSSADRWKALERDVDVLKTDIIEYLQAEHQHLLPIINPVDLASTAIEAAYCDWEDALSLDYTGVVITGFGSDDFMPSFQNIHVHSFVGSKLLWSKIKSDEITFEANKGSMIQPFAQRSMVETFTQGASPEVWRTVRESYGKHAADACRQAAKAAGVAIPEADIEAAIAQSVPAFTKGWAYATFNAHLRPLHSVVSGLAIPEIAELAETLVMLESLKEKVTSRTQSVGGPIDVAVITKAEGLVWIKRKHYFEPKLNSRYFNRQIRPN
ncbi:hypothetical protein [Achromobacter sp. Marseille-Q4954]|uniref:hypothetical protein n=1 Tax=Achromobacter sp. Marseille-Q4954 TaxID=2942203 RepID=UPI002073E5FF|nr:hypothetical protein [Achromobacter sp. Marseille-Q4954]